MNSNKQSSVEWLFEELFNSFEKFNSGDISFAEYMAHNLTLREQAKEIEKGQIIKFAKNCLDKALDLDIRTAFSNVEQYYNETFNTKEK